MNTVASPSRRGRGSLLALSLACLLPLFAQAQDVIVSFASPNFLPGGRESGDVELGRVPEAARAATRTLFPLAPAMPKIDYVGPAFSLGYEVKASAPSNLTVAPDKMVMENNYDIGGGATADTISVTAYGDWSPSNTHSVAAVVVFPTKEFALDSLSYSALNWTHGKVYNEKLRHRWVIQTGGKYYVSASFLGRTGRTDPTGRLDVIRTGRNEPGRLTQWVAYDPTVSIFANLDGPRVTLAAELDAVTAVGVYMDALEYPGDGPGKRQWQLRLVSFEVTGHAAAQ